MAKGLDKDKIIDGVDHLVNLLDNAINEKNRTWYERLKIITLPRELVTPVILSTSQSVCR